MTPRGLARSHPHASSLSQRAVAELVGTGLLLAAVVGSGIMAERLANGSVGLALLANTIATGAGLVALILAFGPVSGAHFNPAVTLADAWQGGLAWRDVPAYLAAQLAGALTGVAAADAMFAEPIFAASQRARAGSPQLLSEFIATFGLLAVIWAVARRRRDATPFAVGAYITAAYWFTASTSFANPAVTLARACTNTFAGIRPQDAPAFIAAQLLGAAAATALLGWLVPAAEAAADAHSPLPTGAALRASSSLVSTTPAARRWPPRSSTPRRRAPPRARRGPLRPTACTPRSRRRWRRWASISRRRGRAS